MAFNPTADRLLVKRAEEVKKTASGFIIPEASVEKPNEGVVVAKGPGRTSKEGVVIPIAVEVGEKIMFEAGSGIPVRVDGEDFLVVDEVRIIAVID